MATQNNQDYFRSVSSESTTYMMVPANGRVRDSPSKLWIAMVVIVVVVLQIASTTGLFVYLNMSLSHVSFLYAALIPVLFLPENKLCIETFCIATLSVIEKFVRFVWLFSRFPRVYDTPKRSAWVHQA